MFPDRLGPEDEIRVVAPSMSLSIVKAEQRKIAKERLETLGFHVSYGKNSFRQDDFFSSSIEERVQDLHESFADPNIKAILTAVDGYNANQLLPYLDYELIEKHPKVFCGFGDTTALSLAINKKTGLITYYGPFFSTFGIKSELDYTLSSFLNAVTNDAPYEITPSSCWNEDPWYKEKAERVLIEQDSYLVMKEGRAEGKLVGGNLSTMNLLQGTEFFPSLKDAILFIEEDRETHTQLFDRNLQSLLQLPEAKGIRGVIIGRFPTASNVTEEALRKVIDTKKELRNIPVIANVNFGHTNPIATIPVGASASIMASNNGTEILIEQVK